MEREKFGSRLGFILVSAGCAIGLGNVWKFPYLCGANGGAAFILIYLVFLLIMGIPVMTCEFAVGRASKQSVAKCFDDLQPKGTFWHTHKVIGIAGCYLLLMFYTSVAGWLIQYTIKGFAGDFNGITTDESAALFGATVSNLPGLLIGCAVVCGISVLVCALGFQKGVEKASKFMMAVLLAIMVVLAIRSVFLPGAVEGIKFYLVPDFSKIQEVGIGNVLYAAMSQAFFTLSIGIGAMVIFGSYLDKSRTLMGEAVNITILDTFVALTSGLIIIPACFAFGIEPGAGSGLVFVTLPNIFAQMAGGQIVAGFFFLFLTFAAMTTVIAVVENLVAINVDLFGWSRNKSVAVVGILLFLLSLPCIFGFTIWSNVHPLGEGTGIMDLEDFIVSNNLLPLGSMGYALFCTCKNGWGWDKFIEEANAGVGFKLPKSLRYYMQFAIPTLITVIYLKGYYDWFYTYHPMESIVVWMCIPVVLLAFVLYCVFSKSKRQNVAA